MSLEVNNARRRTITWEDPAPAARAGQTMGGLNYLRAMTEGRLPAPPIMRLMGIEMVGFEEGRALFAVEPAEYHSNPLGVAHVGLACTMLDSAMGCAVHSTLPAGTAYTTVELNTNLVRSLTHETGRLICEGKVIHVGGRVANAEARLVDASGKLGAHGTTTCMVFQDEAGAPTER